MPEVTYFGATATPSRGFVFPSVASLTVSASQSYFSSIIIPGYSIVPSPASSSGNEGPFANATSSILPVFTPSLLGNGYGGGFVSTPSIYVTKLAPPYGPSSGVPPGYGFSSQPETLASIPTSSTSTKNGTSIFTGLGLPSSTTFAIGNLSLTAGSPVAPASFPIAGSSNFTATTSTLQPAGSSSPSSIAEIIGGVSSSIAIATLGAGLPTSVVSGTALEAQGASAGIVAVSSAGQGSGSTGSAYLSTGTTGLPAFPNLESTSLTALPESPTSLLSKDISSPSAVIGESTLSPGAGGSQLPIATLSPDTTGSLESIQPNSAVAPVTPITRTATGGEIISAPSTPAPVVFSSTVSNGDILLSFSSPSVLIDSSTSNGNIVVETSTASPIPISQTASQGEVIIGTFTPSAVLVSNTASIGEVIIQTPISPAGGAGQGIGNTAIPVNGVQMSSSDTASGLIIGSPTEVGILASPVLSTEQSLGGAISLAVSSTEGQISTQSLPSVTILTPVVGSNGLTSLAVVPTPGEQLSSAGQSGATVLTSILGANGITSLAVIPTPVVGANGLTSLAVFSTPIAAASGVTSPAVILTPIVGANGVTSLAVLATPVVGANGLTSLAIGLGVQASSGTSSTEGYIPVSLSESSQSGESEISTQPTVIPPEASDTTVSSGSSGSTIGSGGNSSVHVPLNPTAPLPFEGSGLKLSLSFGISLASCLVLLLFI